jgi:hypothetical protein
LSKARWKRKTYILRKDPEIAMLAVSTPRNCTILAISGPGIENQKLPEWCTFWGHKLPDNGHFWSHKLPKRFSFISGAINCQNGPDSGSINCQNGRQILYEPSPDIVMLTLISISNFKRNISEIFNNFQYWMTGDIYSGVN